MLNGNAAPIHRPARSGAARPSVEGKIQPGEVLGVKEAAIFFGTTEKAIRRRVDRRLLPCRRLGTRILFLKSELLEFVERLPGTSLEEARENEAMRRQ